MLKSSAPAPAGLMTHQASKAQRDSLLSMNRRSEQAGAWVPIAITPRKMSTTSKAEVKRETAACIKTHRFDELAGQWAKKRT